MFNGVIGNVGKKAVIRLWTSLLVNWEERRAAFRMRVRRPAIIFTRSSLGIFSMATGWLTRKDLRPSCRVYKKEWFKISGRGRPCGLNTWRRHVLFLL